MYYKKTIAAFTGKSYPCDFLIRVTNTFQPIANNVSLL